MSPRSSRTIRERLAIALVCIVFLLPLLWAISTSLRSTGTPLARSIDWIPSPIAWDNYRTVFQVVDAAQFAANSLLIVVAAVPLTVIFASLAGFAMSQLPIRPRRLLLWFSVFCLMVPLTAIWIPRFLLFKEAGLINHRIALVVPSLMGTSPLFALLFLWAFLNVPREIYDAARLDGAGAYRIWAGIGIPQTRAVIASVGALAFVHYWNSFVEPLLLMRTADNFTVSLGLRALYSLDTTNWPIILAGSILTIVPILLIFVLAQRSFLRDAGGSPFR